MPLTFFMHIGKTGGSAVRHALLPYRRELGLRFVHHYVRADALPKNAKLMFCVRDPVDRFISGFNSRLRMGQPANNVPWDAFEERAFSTFKTPNDLAEALDDAEAPLQRKARFAMRGIRHVQQHQHGWFPAPATQYLSRNRRRVLWVGQTSTLSEDFAALRERFWIAQRDTSARRFTPRTPGTCLSLNRTQQTWPHEYRSMVCGRRRICPMGYYGVSSPV
jgi:hypothetical protein